jgi:hypothetical protein
MPGNTTMAGSTLQEDELRLIKLERQKECLKQLSVNVSLPPGESHTAISVLLNSPLTDALLLFAIILFLQLHLIWP